MRTAEEFQTERKQLSNAPTSFRLSTPPVNDEFLNKNSHNFPKKFIFDK